MLTFAELRAANTSRCARWHPGGVADWPLAEWSNAVTGEFGEACNVIKKLNRIRDGIVGNKPGETEETLRRALADELADTLIYLDLLALRAGIDLDLAVIRKFDAVSIREGFPERLSVKQDGAR